MVTVIYRGIRYTHLDQSQLSSTFYELVYLHHQSLEKYIQSMCRKGVNTQVIIKHINFAL